jgi:hypothetical protein
MADVTMARCDEDMSDADIGHGLAPPWQAPILMDRQQIIKARRRLWFPAAASGILGPASPSESLLSKAMTLTGKAEGLQCSDTT